MFRKSVGMDVERGPGLWPGPKFHNLASQHQRGRQSHVIRSGMARPARRRPCTPGTMRPAALAAGRFDSRARVGAPLQAKVPGAVSRDASVRVVPHWFGCNAERANLEKTMITFKECDDPAPDRTASEVAILDLIRLAKAKPDQWFEIDCGSQSDVLVILIALRRRGFVVHTAGRATLKARFGGSTQ